MLIEGLRGRALLIGAVVVVVVLALAASGLLSGPKPTTSPPSSTSSPAGSPSAAATASTAATASAEATASGAPSASATALPSPTQIATSTPAPTRTPTPTTPPTPAPTPAPTVSGWNPAAVSVTLSKIATVPGQPLAIANAGDGSGRLFVAEQDGKVYILSGGSVSGTPLLDISASVTHGGEQGLLGLAFHPDFPADPRVFVHYTDTSGDTVLSSFDVDPGQPDIVVPGSESKILTYDQPYANHNGGGLLFGPDGYLYLALGDGGSGGDPLGNGQRLDTLLGKILRIDVDHPSDGRAYGIPAGNPFVGTGGARPEIWLTGLRNPFRFSFDRSNGDLWIGDVGQNAWEEIDAARRAGGLNFGWNVMEGAHCYSPSSGCATGGLTLPVVEYSHDLGAAVIGGYVYRGAGQPVLRGGYIFSDPYSGRIWAVAATAGVGSPLVQVGSGAGGVAGYGEDEAGELFAASLDGSIYRVVGTAR